MFNTQKLIGLLRKFSEDNLRDSKFSLSNAMTFYYEGKGRAYALCAEWLEEQMRLDGLLGPENDEDLEEGEEEESKVEKAQGLYRRGVRRITKLEGR